MNFDAKCARPKSAGVRKGTMFKTMHKMKKQYLTPDTRVAYVGFEVNFLASTISTGGSSGEDLDDPIDFDPWS